MPDTVEFNDDKVVYKIQALLYLVNVGEPEPLREFVGDLYKETIAQKDHIQAGFIFRIVGFYVPLVTWRICHCFIDSRVAHTNKF